MSLATQIIADVPTVFMQTADFAVSITYKRGGYSVTLTAIVEPSLFSNIGEQGGSTNVERRSYLIQASTLILNSSLTLPQEGDVIEEGSNVYAIPRRTDGPRYEYADENRLMLKINTTLRTGT